MNQADFRRLMLRLKALQASIDENANAIREQNHTTEGAEGPPPEIIIRSVVSLPPAVEAYYQTEQRERSDKNRRESIKRKVEYGGVALLAIYTLFTVGMYCANKQAADAATSAANTAAAQLQLTERPWITIKLTFTEPPQSHSPGPSLTFNTDGTASLNMFVSLKNIGHSVATAIYVRPQMYPPVFERLLTEPIDKQREWCEKVRAETPDDSQLPSLFPDEETTENVTVGMSRVDIEASERSPTFARMPFITPVIYGCVTYRSQTFRGVRETPFIYMLRPLAPRPSGTIPAPNLELIRRYTGLVPD